MTGYAIKIKILDLNLNNLECFAFQRILRVFLYKYFMPFHAIFSSHKKAID